MLSKTLLLLALGSSVLAAEDALPPVGAAPCIACRAPDVDPSALYSPEEWVALRDGEVLREDGARESTPDDLEGATRAATLIRRPPAQVWAVLTDFERWPEFMPLIDETRVGTRDGPRLRVEQRYSIMFVDLAHTTIYDLAPGEGRLSWRLDEEAPHDIEASQGEWELVPIASGRETLVRYDAKMSAGRAVPEFVERMLRGRSLEQLLAGLRAEVARRHPED